MLAIQSTMHAGQGKKVSRLVSTIIKLDRVVSLVIEPPILRQNIVFCPREKIHFLQYIVQRDSLSDVSGVTFLPEQNYFRDSVFRSSTVYKGEPAPIAVMLQLNPSELSYQALCCMLVFMQPCPVHHVVTM